MGSNADVIINNYKAREAYKFIEVDGTARRRYRRTTDRTDENETNDLKQDTGKRKTRLISDFLLPVYETFFEERDPRTVYTGFSKLDAIIGGIEPTDYCLIAARPGVGKTAIATNILLNVAKQGRKPTLFTMEMAKEQVIERMVSTLSNVSLSVIRDRKQIREHEQTAKAIAEAATQLDSPIYINDGGKL